MTAPQDTTPEPDAFEVHRKAAKRAQYALNLLVVLSATAASVFFAYVLYTIRPFSDRASNEVTVPTSAVGVTVPTLRSAKDAVVAVDLRDIDEAPEYRDRLGQAMCKSMGIKIEGRLYRLRVRNGGKEPVAIAAPRMTLKDKSGKTWTVRWLNDVADKSAASPTGMLTLAQSVPEFTLAPGESRQLVVFVEGKAPVGEDFESAEYAADAALKVAMTREDIKATTQ